VIIYSNVTVDGDVHLILENGCKLETKSILLNNNASLTIYGQTPNPSQGAGEGAGELVATSSNDDIPALGGGTSVITIIGGKISATAGILGAGIGTGHSSNNDITIIINGGSVEANAKSHGAGIGLGNTSDGLATIEINGGVVEATAATGAGIGTGNKASGFAQITIKNGTITAESYNGAGIGSGSGNSGSSTGIDIKIEGGVITAISNSGAGIGSGVNSNVNTEVTIKNGTITASSENGAGIGSGSSYYREGNTAVTIENGTITASSTNGADIGKGSTSNGGTTSVAIDGGSISALKYDPAPTGSGVFSSQVALQNVKTAVQITSLTIDGIVSSPSNFKTNADGEFNLYLTNPGSKIIRAEAGGQVYVGSVQAGSGTLDDITAPTVKNLTPAGSDIVCDGDIVIVFSEEMDNTPGTVSLDNGTGSIPLSEAAGSWDPQSKVYTIPYTNLDYNTTYTITISGFQDKAGNIMDDNNNHSFSTMIQPLIPTVTPTSLNIVVGRTSTLSVDFGQGISSATSATITIADDTIVSVSDDNLTAAGPVTVTSLKPGTTSIAVSFNDIASTTINIPVTVVSPPSSSSASPEPSYSNITIQSAINKDEPVTAVITLSPVIDAQGNASVSISGAQIAAAIAQALRYVGEQGNTANGIVIAIDLNLKDAPQSVSIQLSRDAIQRLVDAGVKALQINDGMISAGLDLQALKALLPQSSGDVTITVSPVEDLSSEAEAVIGTRPVYQITISFIQDGKSAYITDLGEGKAAISIPYTPDEDEAVSCLYGVYVDEAGNVYPIEDSAYDSEIGCLVLTTNHFSIYGVGYTAPSARFTDVQGHWALKAIDYVVGHGLFSGTTESTFSPDTPITRGMAIMALGKLAGIAAENYSTVTFADVDANSLYAPYIEWAYQAGIVKGTGNNRFEPERNISREEMAIVLANYARATGFELPITQDAIPYADQDLIGIIYQDAVRAMRQAGIMNGGPDNRFDPKGYVTRAQLSSMLYRYIQLTENSEMSKK